MISAYFDPRAGHGYRLGRVPLGSCDFSLGSYSPAPPPWTVASGSPHGGFDIERDRRALLPFIKAARRAAGGRLDLLASPWSPPAWMKTNGRMNDGGELLPEHRRQWALCYVRFIEAYREEGVPIWGVSVQNEPMAAQRWESCLYSAEQERDFVRDFLGPALHEAGLQDVRILIWDHNRDLMLERANIVLADAEAARYVWGTGFHWYGADCFENVARVHDAWPDKHLLFTEGCQEGGPHPGSWEVGERYSRSIIQDLNHWTEGWIDWNLLLDHRGGPNHVGNYCSAPMLLDAAGTACVVQPSYFHIGHFARFLAPGARRLACEASEGLEATAFLAPDGSLTAVVLNRGDMRRDFALQLDGLEARLQLPPRSIATYVQRPAA